MHPCVDMRAPADLSARPRTPVNGRAAIFPHNQPRMCRRRRFQDQEEGGGVHLLTKGADDGGAAV